MTQESYKDLAAQQREGFESVLPKPVEEPAFIPSKAPCTCGYEEARKKTCKFCMVSPEVKETKPVEEVTASYCPTNGPSSSVTPTPEYWKTHPTPEVKDCDHQWIEGNINCVHCGESIVTTTPPEFQQQKGAEEREHKTDGTLCWCNPRVIHVSANIPPTYASDEIKQRLKYGRKRTV